MKHPLVQVTFETSPSFGKRTCSPGWYWDHQTPFTDYDIFYVLAGKGRMTLGTDSFELQKHSCVIMRPGDLPKATQDAKDRLTVLFLHFRLTGADGSAVDAFPFPRFTVVGDAFRAEDHLYQMMDLLEFSPALHELEFDALMKQFFVNLFRLHAAPDVTSDCSGKQLQKVRQIMASIREDGGVGIEMEKLAHKAGMSPDYMSRLFKACTGATLKEFIARTKVERARELLVQTRMNVSEVAERLGYSDVYAFSKSFKRVFNVSPSRYIANVRLTRQTRMRD